jgi:hypothetical protein
MLEYVSVLPITPLASTKDIVKVFDYRCKLMNSSVHERGIAIGDCSHSQAFDFQIKESN